MSDAITMTNAVVLIADLQEGIIHVATTADPEALRRSAVALVRAAILLEIPVIFSVVPTMGGVVSPLLDELLEVMPGAIPIVRGNANPFADPITCAAIAVTGRRSLVIAGVATEIAVQLPALAARKDGYDVSVLIDACSGLDPRSEDAALRRMAAHGVELSSVATFIAELAGDFTTELGRGAMTILGTIRPPAHSQAHGHDHAH